jgi:predicted peptidase
MPPIYIQHGVADKVVPVECSRILAKRIEEVCGGERVLYEEFEDYTHGDMRFHEEANILKMIIWLKKVLNV